MRNDDSSMEKNQWHSTSTSELLEILKTSGLDVPEGLPEELVRRSEETLHPLCDILLGRGFDDSEDGDGDTWAPIHALHLLGAIGNPEAVPAILEGNFNPEAFDVDEVNGLLRSLR